MVRIAGIVLALCVASLASAQSLGDVARKERERREKNKSQGVEALQFSEDEIFEEEEDDASADASDLGEDAEADEAFEGDESAAGRPPIPDRIDIPLEPSSGEADEGADRYETERRERARQEAEWRGRFQQARDRLAAARERKALFDGLHLAQGEYYVDENGNVVIRNLADLKRMVAEAEQELRAAEESLSELQEEARRAGIPPGWRR